MMRDFCDHLLAQSLIDEPRHAQLGALLAAKPESAVTVVLRAGMVPEAALMLSLSAYLGWPLWSLEQLMRRNRHVSDSLQALGVQLAWCRAQGVALWVEAAHEGGHVCCAASNFLSASVQQLLAMQAQLSGKPLRMILARAADVQSLLDASSQGQQTLAGAQSAGDLHSLRELAEEGPIVELVNSLLSQAVTQRASDIHIEPTGQERLQGFVVRVRVDGVMRDLSHFGADRFDATVCRIKILSQLDIAERRLPQDGRMTARIHGESFDVRVSVMPGVRGESVVLRLLRQDRPTYSLADLGMHSDHAAQFARWVASPNGIVLVTGPTGSGKTTTLYTALDLGNDGLKKIITVEDPVEYKIAGVVQSQVNSEIGYTFAHALRSILRHDPDVILIGEIRDGETAGIAVQSALTGHLVFSTLHTNSAAGAVTRLSDMGIDRFLLASSLRGVMAQRLVRRLCPDCKQPVAQVAQLGEQDARVLQQGLLSLQGMLGEGGEPGKQDGARESTLTDVQNISQPHFKRSLYRPVGCDTCMHTGFLGRMAVYELFDVDEALREQILSKTSEAHIVAYLRERGVRSMVHDGFLKVWQGLTTVGEVMGVSD
jgi:general secretion pathway protein E